MNIDERMNALKRKLAEIRISKNKSQRWLAMRTGMARKSIRKIETDFDGGNPTMRTLVKYCAGLKIDLAELLEEMEK